MNNAIRYSRNSASSDVLFEYLVSATTSEPDFLHHAGALRDYVEKIRQKAVILEAWDNDRLIGLLVGYYNDPTKKVAFMPLLSVLRPYRGKGPGWKMALEGIKYARENNFERIRIEVVMANKKAVSFYERLNFSIVGEGERGDSWMMELCL